MDPNPPELVENKVIVEIDTQPIKRRRKKKSMVWDHFTTETTTSGTTKAFCNHCNKSYAYMSGGKASGTSHLKRHIELGICDKCPKTNLLVPNNKKQRRDQDGCSREMAKMIIMHDYPLHMVEHPGFASFVKALRPQYSVSSFDAVRGDCVEMFMSEKQKLSELIGDIPGGVNLTVDLWLSTQSVGYAFVTGHFVDKDWRLTHRLLNVSVVACPDSDSALNQPVARCLSEWKLEGRVSSLTLSQSSVSKACVDNLRGFLSFRNQHVLNGQLLMGECYARVLSSMAQEALAADEEIREAVKKVRDSVKCVTTNEACGDKFEEVKRLFQPSSSAPYRDLLIDSQGRWDTSYEMLLAGYEHRQLFSCLETCCPGYKISISPEEWRKIESLCLCLKVLYEAGEVLTRPNHLKTANCFYKEMTKLQLELSHHTAVGEEGLGNLVNSLREKFDLYWRGCYLVAAVAAVMDPRYKMQHVKETFTESYGEEDAEEWIKTVGDAVHDLYHSYSDHNLIDSYVDDGFTETEVVVVAQEPHFHQDNGKEQLGGETSPQSEQTTESCCQHETQPKVEKQNVSEEYQDHTSFMDDVLLEEGSTLVTVGDSFSDFEITDIPEMKPELDQYLDDGLVSKSEEDFDVLGWWRVNSTNYPTLSKMAADLLSVPFSTVSAESVFDTEVKQMDSYRTSLPRGTLEALLCTKDWLKNQTL
ncbi:zinc finger BED domain-containing protein DAYSLEEPER-like [Raphanus sativus]|uniref:Zinc finger BED domain-containing protein DAYSLEEPER-like n=1 Tax=Raphanus sativus TaxID=3726 RepID=A0A9W3D0I0_RAPSA|nr:zinc finger BED domain-containing protein DAYSLEEPER-like [Raphanus sativus]